ncbi:unnamed protein product [Lactuca saligna]|uniref:Uncharacterized protein n=1 Tax=Lactuca saligna TaxID=75948 RepID=A0AA36ENC6_LACSI|nr:unnamed protein product [Lactuca saligna]
MLCHLMMLHEIRDVVATRDGRLRFELQNGVVEYGETEFCLISGLRYGPYVDVINTKCNKKNCITESVVPKCIIGWDTDMCIPSVVYELADNVYNWN